jgi:hypothetical protein
MVTFLITSVLVSGLIAIAIYFWQKPAHRTETAELPPPPVTSLFDNQNPQFTEAPEKQLRETQQPFEAQPESKALPATQENGERETKITAAREFIESWKQSPDRTSTAKMLHLAADTDDAETYNSAAELALNVWQEGKLPDVSAAELHSLLNSEYWLLSSRTRSSGAGFILKRTLSRARRELESVNYPTP